MKECELGAYWKMVGSSIAGSLGFPLFVEPNRSSSAVDLLATAASLRLTHLLRRRITHHIQLTSFPKKLASLIDISFHAKVTWCLRALHFSGDGETGNSPKNERISHWRDRDPRNDKKWTNILLGVNILAFVFSVASKGKLLQWGAKVNGLIDQGQLWRLVTSSFLHANVGHLLINCYSLNSIGPTVEKISGTRRFLAVYFASAIASSYVSYSFCKAPSVGASGAIFGLVGSFVVFVARHRKVFGSGKEDLKHIALTIILNMAIGITSRGIDNWGHFGGFVGGVVTSWLLGPAWKQEPSSFDNGRRTFIDRAPIFYLINGRRRT